MSIEKVSHRIFTCDRCGEKSQIKNDKHFTNWSTIIINTEEFNEGSDTYHVCPTCRKDFYKWYENRLGQ